MLVSGYQRECCLVINHEDESDNTACRGGLPPVAMRARKVPAPSPRTFTLAASNTRRSHRLSLVMKPSVACAILCLHPHLDNHDTERAAFRIEEVKEITCSGLTNRTVGDGVGKADEELMSLSAPGASRRTVQRSVSNQQALKPSPYHPRLR